MKDHEGPTVQLQNVAKVLAA